MQRQNADSLPSFTFSTKSFLTQKFGSLGYVPQTNHKAEYLLLSAFIQTAAFLWPVLAFIGLWPNWQAYGKC